MMSIHNDLWDIDPASLETDLLWEHYEACLKAHDWTYMYSSNPEFLQQGRDQAEHIALTRKLTETEDSYRSDAVYQSEAFLPET